MSELFSDTILQLERSLLASLGVAVELKQHSLALNGRQLTLYAVGNPELLLDELIENGMEADLVDERLPYWAEFWPSSIALADRLLQASPFQDGEAVLEIGCGLGLAGTAAGMTGANVLFTDYQPHALEFAQLNHFANCGHTAKTALMDWRTPNLDHCYRHILASDVCYESRFFAPLANLIETLLAPDGTVWVSEPNRAIAGEFYLMMRNRGWRLDKWQTTATSMNGPSIAVTITQMSRP